MTRLAVAACALGLASATRIIGLPGISAADRSACAHISTASHKGDVRLRNFEVGGLVQSSRRHASATLLPHYPDKLFHDKIAIHPYRPLRHPFSVDGFYCTDGSRIHFWFSRTQANLSIPFVTSAAVLRRAGAASVTVSGAPQSEAPSLYYVEPFFYKPGVAVIRFGRGRTVIDRLVVNVYICRKGLPHC